MRMEGVGWGGGRIWMEEGGNGLQECRGRDVGVGSKRE